MKKKPLTLLSIEYNMNNDMNMFKKMCIHFDASMEDATEYLADGSISWQGFVNEFELSIYNSAQEVIVNTIVDAIDDDTDQIDATIGKIVDVYLDMAINNNAKIVLETAIEVSDTSIEIATNPKMAMVKKITGKALNKIMNNKIKKRIKESIVDDMREALFEAVSNAVTDAIQR